MTKAQYRQLAELKDVLSNDNFELHLFSPEEFANPYDPLVAEIKQYGVRF